MENKAIARRFRLLSQLMELHDENPFKIRSITNAAFKIDKLPLALAGLPLTDLEKVEGIGKGLASKISELLHTGTMQELEELLQKTPPGVVDMLSIKGIGSKKAAIIWHELHIDTVGELFYACNENRLIEAKGFGLKTQEEIRKAIEFKMASSGRFLYAHIEAFVTSLSQDLSLWARESAGDPEALLGVAGQFRRCCEIVDELVLVMGTAQPAAMIQHIANFKALEFKWQDEDLFAEAESGLKIRLKIVDHGAYYLRWFIETGNSLHVEQVLARVKSDTFTSEAAIYTEAGLQYTPPELREGGDEILLAEKQALPELIRFTDLKGSLHNHSTWSDGVHTLKEMALFCRDVLHLEYLGISDHSQSAFYAKGLSEQRVREQQAEIDQLNKELAPFRIFKGIESDILYDGRLDYPEAILKTFDFVVASVHSQLKMDETKATSRLITAIENPYTTILGHPTGRLLLSRAGYPIDYKKVIDACAANGVVIEINANPLRLDLDWRWHHYALEKGVLLAINPDAHRQEGFYDMHAGLRIARKGGLTADKNLNSFNLAEISVYFEQKKKNSA